MSIHLDLNPAQASALQQLLVRESLRQSKLTKPRPIYNSRAMVAWDKQRATAVGGGWIQIVQTRDGRLMVLDEEGKLKGFPVNRVATGLYQHGAQDPIVGDVLVCNEGDID